MYTPLSSLMARAYQDALLEDARQVQVLRGARVATPRLQHRVLARTGQLLISIGLWLRQRYEPLLYPGPETCPSPAGKPSA